MRSALSLTLVSQFYAILLMLIECAVVTSIQAQQVTLKSARRAACARCERGEGCGGGLLGKLAAPSMTTITLPIPHESSFKLGQRVELILPADGVMRAAAALYLLPLMALLLGAYIGDTVFASDGASILGAATSLALVVLCMKALAPKFRSSFLVPTIRVKHNDEA